MTSGNYLLSLSGLRSSLSPLNFAGWGSLILGFLEGPASCRDIVFCGDGGGGGGGGVSHSAVLPLGRSGVHGKAPGGVCCLCCWLEGILIPKTCSTILWRLESCGLGTGRWAACPAAACAAAASSAACCSWRRAACCKSCSVLRSSSESVSRSPGWRRVPELYGVEPAGPGARSESVV